MYFDMLSLAAVVQELESRAVAGRVQSVVQPHPLAVALEIYANQARSHLLLTADPSHPRVHFTAEKPRRGTDVASPLLLQLRKRLVGARLTSVVQPPWERILEMEFVRGDEVYTLVAEIMGRHSNLALLDADRRIVECVKRVGPDVNRYRVVLPNQPYVRPAPQDKPPLPEWDAERLAAALARSPNAPPERALVGSIRGLSPLAAREAVARAGGSDAERLLACLRGLFAPLDTGEWSPSVGIERGVPSAYAPYALTQFAEHRTLPSLSEAIEVYLQAQETVDPYAAARVSVAGALAEAMRTLERRRAALQRGLRSEADVQVLLTKGRLLLAHAHEVQKGQASVVVPGLEGEDIAIELDPMLTAAENAQRYFRAYRKARAASEEVPRKLDALDAEVGYVRQLESDLAMAEIRPEIDEVVAALVEAGYARPDVRRERSKPSRSGPLAFESPDGFRVLVGRNSRQNEEVTFRAAAPDDVWLHARGVPGAHVVIRTGGGPVPDATLRFAAQLAAFYSAARGDASVQVDWTYRRHVRHLTGAKPGMVRYAHEQGIIVEPRAPD